jgi:hypothetical protein
MWSDRLLQNLNVCIENDREPVKYKLRNHELADKLIADFTGMSEFLFYMGLLS